MVRNPFLNALAATAYIVLIVLVINGISDIQSLESSLVMPVIFLSLFVLSAAVMGYIFCYQPLRLYLDGKKEFAAKLFLKTVGIFAGITMVIVLGYILYTYLSVN